jgi:hypothetical protein
MYKVKDWPPEVEFKEKLGRHFQAGRSALSRARRGTLWTEGMAAAHGHAGFCVQEGMASLLMQAPCQQHRLPRHSNPRITDNPQPAAASRKQEFCEMLPLPELTLPMLGSAPLNLATALRQQDNPTDLGPKTYIAYGRWVCLCLRNRDVIAGARGAPQAWTRPPSPCDHGHACTP